MADAKIEVDGDDSFILGANSFITPTTLGPGQYVMAMNTINRGGYAQTRPGSKSLPFEIPGTNFQGITLFNPHEAAPCLVFMVDGLVYHSPYPFSTYHHLENLKFSPYSKYASWAKCIQSTDYTPDGTLIVLDAPRDVLIIQDGSTRAAYWDGGSSGHIDPTPSNQEFTKEGFDGTPVGLWMKWSNNRLWVSRHDMVFASDIGNPLKFTEAQYINEGRAFYLPGPCTGITETSDQQGIICFTPESGVFLRSSIQDRTQWLTTPDFQKTILPNVGCVAPRSIVQQHGLVWWYTTKGLINLDDALKLYISSRLNVQDQEMASSKANVSWDVSMVAGSFFENFIFHAVPNGDKLNTRLHVLDQAPQEGEYVNSWPSYWMGWRPIEFARGIISSQERCFCASYDYDNKFRIWELFLDDRTDNGIPITSYIQTRTHFFKNRDFKKFRYGEVEFDGISGDTGVMIAASGIRGGYQEVGNKDIASLIGQIYYDVLYGQDANDIFGSTSQSRVVKTRDDPEPSDCNSECIESETRGLIDKGFSLLIVWSGVATVSAYRIFAQGWGEAYQGLCEPNETGETRLLTPAGCGSSEILSSKRGFTSYYATATYSRIDPTSGLPITNTSTQSSIISQEDATRKATAMAKWYVQSYIGEVV